MCRTPPRPLEARPVEEPDRERAHGDDADEDQGERDVRLALRVALAKTIHLLGGAGGIRTPDLLSAIQALSQLSYSPIGGYAANEAAVTASRARRARRLRQTQPRRA